MHKTKVATFWRILSDNTVYSQANYEADVESIKGVYQAKGYKDVVVKDPILDVYVVEPERQAREDQAAGADHDPDRRGRQVLHQRDHASSRVRQNGQPAEPAEPAVFSASGAAEAVLRAQARRRS